MLEQELTHLNDDCLLSIFSFLSPLPDLISLSKACRVRSISLCLHCALLRCMQYAVSPCLISLYSHLHVSTSIYPYIASLIMNCDIFGRMLEDQVKLRIITSLSVQRFKSLTGDGRMRLLVLASATSNQSMTAETARLAARTRNCRHAYHSLKDAVEGSR